MNVDMISIGPNERGVMVIKAKDKTRAAQRKGALKNWKKTGKTIIKYLRKRDISGDDLRREFWVHEEASRYGLYSEGTFYI
jgi:hypothetical protein